MLTFLLLHSQDDVTWTILMLYVMDDTYVICYGRYLCYMLWTILMLYVMDDTYVICYGRCYLAQKTRIRRRLSSDRITVDGEWKWIGFIIRNVNILVLICSIIWIME